MFTELYIEACFGVAKAYRWWMEVYAGWGHMVADAARFTTRHGSDPPQHPFQQDR
jgi:hypothetical protein